MKSEKEIRDKIEQLEEYLKRDKPITSLYPLERTESFLGGIKWVLDEDDKIIQIGDDEDDE